LKVTEWSITPIDTDTNAMTETILYSGSKPVRMVSGMINYSDALGKSLVSKS
jgi:hypothetical protein